jgi:hypothetical protein
MENKISVKSENFEKQVLDVFHFVFRFFFNFCDFQQLGSLSG